jgi:tetratricopeptide (TPR) repeat protein
MPRFRLQKYVLGLILVLGLDTCPAMTAADEPEKVDSSLTFLAHQETIYVNVENDSTIAWVKPIFAALDTLFVRETKPRTIAVEVTLHPDRPADVIVAGRPALTAAEIKALLLAADPARSPRSRVVDITFRIVAQINGGTSPKSGPMTPPLQTPDDHKLASFKPLPAAGKLSLMRSWARTEAIPLLAEFARHRDQPPDEATRNFGKVLGQSVKREGPVDVAALTEQNPDYWRAMFQSAPDDPLVHAARVALHVANGEIDQARRLADALALFGDDDNWGSSYVLRDFRLSVQLFDEEITARIRKGIALNDQGQLAEALKVYDSVLKDHPKSAWALYERFQSTMASRLKAKAPFDALMQGWPATRKSIIEADPLFGAMASAEGPDAIYDLLLRKEIETLFKDRAQFNHDVLRYADIALDLGQPGFAAMLYWNAKRSPKPEAYGKRHLIEDMLYGLEQLGIKDLKSRFPGDHAREFKRIDGERAKRKRESPVFRPQS